MPIELTIRGIEQVNARLAQLAQEYPQQARAALYQEAEIEMAESKRRVPVDTGALHDSGRVEVVDDGVRLAYGDAAVDYAIYVHENLEALHPVGEAKFLERPILEALPYLAERVARRIRRLMGM